MNKIEKIKELTKKLNAASEAYYKNDIEIMSNFEYDRLYDELVELENETGITLNDSPTVKVGYETVQQLPKEAHEKRMLSLDKTKSIAELKVWLGNQKGLLSWKIDGLTVVLTYEGGELVKAVTRGNGEIGEVITNNAKTFKNLPKRIPFKGELVIRGEAFIKYSDFDKINQKIPEFDAKYKNPRNLCSGSVRQLNSEITAHRNVNFDCFSLEKAEYKKILDEEFVNLDEIWKNSKKNQLSWLEKMGFQVVEYKEVTTDNIEDTVKDFSERIAEYDVPSDGLVLIYDDIAYGDSLGSTAKFPRNSIAFKWKDDMMETVLEEIIWSPSRTGLINPIARFNPVELEGTVVSRASVHNVSILKELNLKVGDRIKVYKANMIIPQIEENLSKTDEEVVLPETCPACDYGVELKSDLGVETLFCSNRLCPAKRIKSFSLFVSRDAMNIENLSEATLEKFIGMGLIKTLPDIFYLKNYRAEITSMEGFGEKSFDNLVNAVEKSKKVTVAKFIYALGISGIGVANGKLIARHFDNNWEKIQNASAEELMQIDGIGEVVANAFVDFLHDDENKKSVEKLLDIVEFDVEPQGLTDGDLRGKTFVITGNVHIYKNRNELKSAIEANGGKVTGSVSSNTDFLINNDIDSASSKNKKAKELGIPIISEDEFARMIK
ncbi:MAG: NAD-dependent DNA ligase LigA [[Eubacterium] brachy]|nr:NAD-dependent DNA ligase LigA [[Eubacterium] brachy]